MHKYRLAGFLVLGLLVVLALSLSGCQAATPTAAVPDTPVTTAAPEETSAPEVTEPAPPEEMAVEVPFLELWQGSPHADASAEAFVHWNEEDPAEVPVACAKCHSTPGFQDYVGADGSEAFVVDANAPIGTTVTCVACHNEATLNLSTVQFPSGVELTGVGSEAVCLTCHQGTASEAQVNANIEEAGVADEDTVSEAVTFTNIHYFAAAVSRYGTVVNGGYQYDNKAYDALFAHAGGIDECTECHNSHTLELKVDVCTACHEGATDIEGVRAIRVLTSGLDYDGDGNVEESIKDEIDGLREALYLTLQAYSQTVSEAPLIYTAEAYPYFFNDTNANGAVDEEEAAFPNAYKSWTPRAVKAAFNFQTATKDPGGYAHGGKYIIELLYDSIEDLNTALAESEQTDLTAFVRGDPGHFDGSTEAWRHWDEEGAVPGSCAKCHSDDGLPTFLANGANIATGPSNGMMCETCHSSLEDFSRYEVESVRFPSGATIGFTDEPDANLCLNCHQGREAGNTVDARIGDNPDDTVVERLSFVNVHYFAAGATLFGTEAKGVYEYEGQEYNGRFAHIGNYDSCAECHDPHILNVRADDCQGCHQVEDPRDIRMNLTEDYDGDGDVEEGLFGEITTLQEKLYAALLAYADSTAGTPIVYDSHSHPYWFIDSNADGEAGAEEVNSDNRYATWTPRLLRAAYNYQYSQKDPGAFAHNAAYILQVLYDSIDDVGGDTAGLIRPAVTAAAE